MKEFWIFRLKNFINITDINYYKYTFLILYILFDLNEKEIKFIFFDEKSLLFSVFLEFFSFYLKKIA